METTYHTPSMQWHRIDSEPLLITVSTGSATPPITPVDDDGDASEALVKSSFNQKDWDW